MSGDGSAPPEAESFNFYTNFDDDKLHFWKAFQRGDIVHDATRDRLKNDVLVGKIKGIVDTRYPDDTTVTRNEVDAIINKKIDEITSQDMLNRMFVSLPNKENVVNLTTREGYTLGYTLKQDLSYQYVDINNDEPDMKSMIESTFNKKNCVYKIHFTDKECIQPFMTNFFGKYNRNVVYDTGFSQEYIPKLGDNTLRSKTYCSNKIDAAASSNHNILNAGNNQSFVLPLLYDNDQQIYLKLKTEKNTESTKKAKGSGTYEFSILIKPSNDESSKATINIHGDVFSIKNVANAIGLLDGERAGEEIFKIQYGTIGLIYEKLKEEKLRLDDTTIRNCLLSLKTIGDMSRILDVQIVNEVNVNPSLNGSAILITRDKLLESHAIKLNIPVMRYYKANNKEGRYLNIFLPQEVGLTPEDLQKQYDEWYRYIINNRDKITSLQKTIETIMNEDYYNIQGRRVKSLQILKYFDTRLLFNIYRYLSLIILFLNNYANDNIKNYDILRDIYWLVKRLPEDIANMTTDNIIELIIGVGSTEYEHYKDKMYGYVYGGKIQGNNKTLDNSIALFNNYIGENNDNCWHKKYIELREILDVILDDELKENYSVENDIVDSIDDLKFKVVCEAAAEGEGEGERKCKTEECPVSRQKRFVLLINLKNRTIQAIKKITNKFERDDNKKNRIEKYTKCIIEEQSLVSNLDQKGGNIKLKEDNDFEINGENLDVLLGDIYYLHQAYLSVLNYDLEEEGYEMMYNNLRQIMEIDDIFSFLELGGEMVEGGEINAIKSAVEAKAEAELAEAARKVEEEARLNVARKVEEEAALRAHAERLKVVRRAQTEGYDTDQIGYSDDEEEAETDDEANAALRANEALRAHAEGLKKARPRSRVISRARPRPRAETAVAVGTKRNISQIASGKNKRTKKKRKSKQRRKSSKK